MTTRPTPAQVASIATACVFAPPFGFVGVILGGVGIVLVLLAVTIFEFFFSFDEFKRENDRANRAHMHIDPKDEA